MKILLTNDDGYGAPGLENLKKALSRFHEVWTVAPYKNMSGSSCLFTFGSMELYKFSERDFALAGSPVDCVISAVNGNYVPFKPDVVLSGINSGPNFGTDIIYSGTCGAARQASLLGIPGIALSVEYPELNPSLKDKINYNGLSSFIAEYLEDLIKFDFENYYLNINCESAEHFSEYKGVVNSTVSRRVYPNNIMLKNEGDKILSCMTGGMVKNYGDENCDSFVSEKGYIAVSAIKTEPSCSLTVLNDMLKTIKF